jgi:hypothetical protein
MKQHINYNIYIFDIPINKCFDVHVFSYSLQIYNMICFYCDGLYMFQNFQLHFYTMDVIIVIAIAMSIPHDLITMNPSHSPRIYV